mgnify:CR=1
MYKDVYNDRSCLLTASRAAKLSGSKVKDQKRAFVQARKDCKADPETASMFGFNTISIPILA